MLSFHTQMKSAYEALYEKDPLKRLRGKAWEKYLELGIPNKSESYRYIKIPSIVEKNYSHVSSSKIIDIEPYILPECKDAVLVFINGSFSRELSQTTDLPEQMIKIPLSEATKTYGAFLTNQWTQSLKSELDPFASLNGALHPEGLFLFIPSHVSVNKPIQILHMVISDEQSMTQPRLHLYAGKNSEATLIFQTISPNHLPHGINQVLELSLDEDARLQMVQMHGNLHGWHLDAMRASLKRSSQLKSVCLTLGSQTTRHDYRIALTGEGAEADLKGIAYLQAKKEAHFHVLMEHHAPDCRSNQEFKTILKELNRASFGGKIYVHQNAQKTAAYQRNSNLVLDDLSIVYSKPHLEIEADDVQASHGSTVGQIDFEQLFYLKTRGLSEHQAKQILIEGFCHEILTHVGISSLSEMFRKEILI